MRANRRLRSVCASAHFGKPRLQRSVMSTTKTQINLRISTSAHADLSLRLGTYPLRKHAYSNILRILPPKNENFQIKYSDIFHISAQNIDCGYSLEPPRQGGSNKYPQSMFLSKNKENNVYPSFTT